MSTINTLIIPGIQLWMQATGTKEKKKGATGWDSHEDYSSSRGKNQQAPTVNIEIAAAVESTQPFTRPQRSDLSIAVGRRISTDTGCAGCRRAQRKRLNVKNTTTTRLIQDEPASLLLLFHTVSYTCSVLLAAVGCVLTMLSHGRRFWRSVLSSEDSC